MSVVTPVTRGPSDGPGAIAGIVAHAAGKKSPADSRGRGMGFDPAPVGIGIPPSGMPCPTWMKSRTIRLSATWSDWFVSEMMRDVSVMSMPLTKAPRPALTTTSVSAVEMMVSAREKPASCWLCICGKVRRQHELLRSARRDVENDHLQLAQICVEVSNPNLAAESPERAGDVVRRPEEVVQTGRDDLHERAVVGGVAKSVRTGIAHVARA